MFLPASRYASAGTSLSSMGDVVFTFKCTGENGISKAGIGSVCGALAMGGCQMGLDGEEGLSPPPRRLAFVSRIAYH